MYKFRNTATGHYLAYFAGRGDFISPRYTATGRFYSIDLVNYHIKRAIDCKMDYFLDNVELVSYKLVETPGPLNIKNVRDRCEQQMIVNKLRE